MHELALTLGLQSWKPWLAALVLPPVPLLLLILAGARLMFTRRWTAWLLILLGVAGLWLLSTSAVAWGLAQWLLHPPPALAAAQVADLKRAPRTAIVVLGGGRRLLAPEYGVSSLTPRSIERLRYGVWLARETGLPLAFSGGVGHGAPPGPSEAEIAARIAEREFGRPLRWTEGESRDTHENAVKTVPLLRAQGIDTIVLVTNAVHMPRALHNFEAAAQGTKMRIVAAPMGLPGPYNLRAIDWLPSADATQQNWIVLHEWLGGLLGA